MKRKNSVWISTMFVVLLITGLSSCKKDEQKPDDHHDHNHEHNEEELITTFTITFTDAAGIQPIVEATFRDTDGEGGNPPTTFDNIVLQSNTTYNASISLLNESVTPTEDITQEIQEEGDEHIFCFEQTNVNITITRTDSDGTYGIGLTSDWTTSDASNGTVVISLKHQPGVKNGTCEPGETDIELLFNVEVQ